MFELTYQEEGNERAVPIDLGGVVLGRSPDCDIVIKDFGVSRHHAKVMVDGEQCRLVDLKSKNGTHVNGVAVLEAILNDGDQVALGPPILSGKPIWSCCRLWGTTQRLPSSRPT